MTSKTAAEPTGVPYEEELLCRVAADWLRQRGWQGKLQWLHGDEEAFRQSLTQWTFQLDAEDGTPRALQFQFPDDSIPALAERTLLQSYLRATLAMQRRSDATATAAGEWVLAARAEVEKRLHDLNNRLNSLLVNAGVLTSAHRDGDRLAPFAEQAIRDGDACAEAIRKLTRTLLETRT